MPDTNTPNILVGDITFEVKALRDALALAIQATDKKSRIPILAFVRIDTDDLGSVKITGTDMEVAIEAKVPAIYPPALSSFCVIAKPLLDLLKQLPTGELVTITAINTEPYGAFVKCAGIKAAFPTLPVEDFPRIEPFKHDPKDPIHHLSFDAMALTQAFGRVSCAISTEETRYYLNGIYFTADPVRGCLRLAATDGHRLAVQSCPDIAAPFWHDKKLGATGGVILPRLAVTLLSKLMGKKSCPVGIDLTMTRFRATLPGVTFWTKLIDGTFPDYNRIIPSRKAECELVVPVDALLASAKRVMAMSSERSQPMKVEAVKGDHLYVGGASNVSDNSEIAGVPVPLKTPPGFNVETAFQARYLVDMANACPTKEVTITFAEEIPIKEKDASGNVIAKSPSDSCDGRAPTRFDANEWTMVLMPMRV